MSLQWKGKESAITWFSSSDNPKQGKNEVQNWVWCKFCEANLTKVYRKDRKDWHHEEHPNQESSLPRGGAPSCKERNQRKPVRVVDPANQILVVIQTRRRDQVLSLLNDSKELGDGYLELLVLFVDLDSETNCTVKDDKVDDQNGKKFIGCVPASTAVPKQDRTPARKELKGNDPTIPMYTTWCISWTLRYTLEIDLIEFPQHKLL